MWRGFEHKAAILTAGVAFGTTGTAQALGPQGISPLAVGSARLVVGAAFLALFSLRSKKPRAAFSKKSWFIAAFGVAMYQITFFAAVRATGVAVGTLIALGSAPVLTGTISFLVHREVPMPRWLVATCATTAGIVLLATAKSGIHFGWKGVLLALLAGASCSLFNVASASIFKSGGELTDAMAKIFALAAVIDLPFLFLRGSSHLLRHDGIVMVLWLGFVSTAVAYFLFGFGLQVIRPSSAATLGLAEPATATILAAVVLGEVINLRDYVGILVVALGLIYLASAPN